MGKEHRDEKAQDAALQAKASRLAKLAAMRTSQMVAQVNGGTSLELATEKRELEVTAAEPSAARKPRGSKKQRRAVRKAKGKS